MINPKRLEKRIYTLADIGATKEGGVTRLALTKEYKEAINLITQWMEEAGMHVFLDAAGNLIGRKEGHKTKKPPIVLGSHIDSVKNGGKFDGVIGVIGGIEVVQHLTEEKFNLKRTIEVIAFCEEEGTRFLSGGMFGSRAMVGDIKNSEMEAKDKDGITREQGFKDFGLDPNNIKQAVRNKNAIEIYLEMHIEQGPVLTQKETPLGIVTGITGVSLMEIIVEGEQNHAGGTPMNARKDALLAASEIALTIEEIFNNYGGVSVGTITRMHAQPDQVNIIPGRATMTLDVRDIEIERRDKILKEIENRAENVGQERGVTFQFRPVLHAEPTMCAEEIISTMQTESKKMKLKYHNMPSGGGHDAQIISKIADIGMIFVRSKGGSHNPNEFASIKDITDGTKLLSATVLKYMK
ncbi:allantoate deiminase/N-carbamoyl-L-amino-acid hydrolase [Lentibacillus persicus]|uniref:Allantoate deiminase/N-carbamoyl-L-amino-acid hydrolase n=1 Tax=Lentibacillus persicus TaxID=640948 RepID=A0A1I1VZ28_9BACI|nr:M20 family metallo-hydrolase [Lentibacillus persicus]SFD88336.1 allantoate deiminase/N-carbamoyl-L-amino-acid hydrolase [Lentibacillus persicus]